ncbi:hypothetical protein [Rhodococcus globerulus]|uniref:Transposase n=1 Tax=Rhodococcus globerulus TaxID=33008 RepID=A0ABU4C5V5_RHOGO|nr:hypothetical protein [Rhodococcus globerulus]MDV6271815.1 hypothetical protein [Rhodococcus globerulus]
MEPYLNDTGGDQDRAIELYQWNMAVSAALWEVLCHVEVGLRHAILLGDDHPARCPRQAGRVARFRRKFGGRRMGIRYRAVDDIAAAWGNAQKGRWRGDGGHPFTMDHAIAELNFSVWRFLLAKDREPKLGKSIRKGFLTLLGEARKTICKIFANSSYRSMCCAIALHIMSPSGHILVALITGTTTR